MFKLMALIFTALFLGVFLGLSEAAPPAKNVSIIGGGTGSGGGRLGAFDVTYIPMFGGLMGPANVEIQQKSPMAVAGTVSDFIILLHEAPGTVTNPNAKFVFFVRKNGVSQSLTCEIQGQVDRECSDMVNSVDYLVGDTINLFATHIDSPRQTNAHWTAKLVVD